jgi:PAS domain S-box-containing protein
MDSCAELFENMMEGFALCEMVCDGEGRPCDFRYIRVNAAFERIIGLKREAVTGKTGRELFPGIEPMWVEVYAKVAMEGTARRFDAWFDSRKKHLEVSAYSPCKGQFAAIFLDVTERKETEAALRENEERYRMLVENCSEMLIELDGEGRFRYLSPNHVVQLGYEPAELLGTCAFELVHPDDLPRVLEKFVLPLATVCYRCRHKDGSWRLLESTGRLFDKAPEGRTHSAIISRDITERGREEQRVRQLSGAVEHSPASVVITDTEGNIEYVNPKFTEVTGYSLEEAVGQNPRILKSGELSKETYEELWETIKKGEEWHGEFHNKRKNGELYWELASISPIEDERGVITHFVAVKEDITERKRIEKALRRSQSKLQLALNLAKVVYWERNLTTGMFRFDDHFYALLGTNAEKEGGYEMSVETYIERFVPAKDAAKVEEVVGADLSDCDAHCERGLEHRIIRGDGEERVVAVVVRVVKDAAGRTIRTYGATQDITERKRFEQALLESEARFRTICENSPVGIFMMDEESNLTYINRAGRRITDRSLEEVAGQRWREIIHPEDRERVKGEWETLVGTQATLQSKRRYLRKDEKVVWVNMTCAPVHENGRLRGFMGILEDITERKQLETQFLRAQRMESIGTLAGGIAHDLNNALAPILMAVEILKRQVPDADSQRLLEVMEASAQHGSDLVKQVLSFARGVEGRTIMVNPIHLLNEIEAMIRDTFPKNIDFKLNASGDVWTVTGDPTHLHQAFTNLCVNARDAMPNGGTLKVTVENVTVDEVYAHMNPDAKAGVHVLVMIEDTGGGIAAGIRERIFEPFFTTKEIGKGTGLGLSTTMAILKSHGGFITLYSEMGKGSAFKVYLPANTSGMPVEGVPAEKTELPCGNGELILLVDDEVRLRTVAQNTLERFGYRVLLAANGAEAVAIYARMGRQIDVVLTDMAMPVMDGPSMIVVLRALNPNVKVIGSSGLGPNGGDAKALDGCVKHFIPKPYTANTMLKILAKVLREEGGDLGNC